VSQLRAQRGQSQSRPPRPVGEFGTNSAERAACTACHFRSARDRHRWRRRRSWREVGTATTGGGPARARTVAPQSTSYRRSITPVSIAWRRSERLRASAKASGSASTTAATRPARCVPRPSPPWQAHIGGSGSTSAAQGVSDMSFCALGHATFSDRRQRPDRRRRARDCVHQDPAGPQRFDLRKTTVDNVLDRVQKSRQVKLSAEGSVRERRTINYQSGARSSDEPGRTPDRGTAIPESDLETRPPRPDHVPDRAILSNSPP
jgi:hypothetical protein